MNFSGTINVRERLVFLFAVKQLNLNLYIAVGKEVCISCVCLSSTYSVLLLFLLLLLFVCFVFVDNFIEVTLNPLFYENINRLNKTDKTCI